MKIIEFRVILPMTAEEYQVGQLWSVNEASKENTGGGDGIEFKVNEPFDKEPVWTAGDGTVYDKGQLTHKIYHLSSKCPRVIKAVMSDEQLQVHEKAWNAYPYCRTVISNPAYMKQNFEIKIETMHLNDRGTSENAHNLPPELLAKRQVVTIDIAHDHCDTKDYKEVHDPKKFKSEKTGRGPLTEKDWKTTQEPVMCAYKLVTYHFKWFGLQSIVENIIGKTEQRLFFLFHRQVFTWIDKWHGLTMADIREIEEKGKEELQKQLKEGAVRGYTGTE